MVGIFLYFCARQKGYSEGRDMVEYHDTCHVESLSLSCFALLSLWKQQKQKQRETWIGDRKGIDRENLGKRCGLEGSLYEKTGLVLESDQPPLL